jgi:hypothetical protein
MRTRAVTITLRLIVPDDDGLDETVDFAGEAPMTFLAYVLDEVAEAILDETLGALRAEFGDGVESISHTQTIEAPADDSEDW